ncbi:hypothetical protein [Helicobacter sp. 23-1045]
MIFLADSADLGQDSAKNAESNAKITHPLIPSAREWESISSLRDLRKQVVAIY